MQDINLYQLFRFYVKNWLTIVIILSFSLVLGIVYNNFIQTPLYKSDATLLLVRSNAVSQDVALINNYIELFKSRRVLDPVIKKQNIDMTYDELVKYVEASAEKDTDVIKVAISTDSPEKSEKFIEQAVESFRKNVKELYTSDNIQVVDEASLAEKPYNIRTFWVVTTAFATGLIMAIIWLFFVYDYRLNVQTSKKDNQPNVNIIKEKDAIEKKSNNDLSASEIADVNVIHEHQGMSYLNRAAYARELYSKERQIRR